MSARFFVVDQNVLRRPTPTLDRLLHFPSAHFVFTDTALVELVKPDKWEENVQKGFAKFLHVPERCHMSISVQEAMESELDRGAPANNMLLRREFTSLLRELIAGSGTGKHSQDLKDRIEAVRTVLKQHDLNAEAAKEEVVKYVSFLKDALSAADLAVCKKESIARGARAVIANRAGRGMYYAYMRSFFDGTYAQAAQLRRQRCLTWRWLTLRIHHALQWLGDGGIETAKPANVLNDYLDQDYVVLASFFSGLITHERSMVDASVDLEWIVRGALLPRAGRSRPRRGQQPINAG